MGAFNFILCRRKMPKLQNTSIWDPNVFTVFKDNLWYSTYCTINLWNRKGHLGYERCVYLSVIYCLYKVRVSYCPLSYLQHLLLSFFISPSRVQTSKQYLGMWLDRVCHLPKPSVLFRSNIDKEISDHQTHSDITKKEGTVWKICERYVTELRYQNMLTNINSVVVCNIAL